MSKLPARLFFNAFILLTALAFSAAAQQTQQTKFNGDSPSATVQTFYKAVRERRFRDALMMTNLRSAVADLSPAEMADLAPEFEPMAVRVPEKVEINNESITSDGDAIVFIRSVNQRNGGPALDAINLRREKNSWTILTADEETEMLAKKEGKDYFFKLRVDTRHADIELTLQDIMTAQIAYQQKNGTFTDLQTLANQRLIPSEVLDSAVMGYSFRLQLSGDRKKYTVNAEPSIYGKTGKLSYLLESASGKTNNPRIQNADKNGAPLSVDKLK